MKIRFAFLTGILALTGFVVQAQSFGGSLSFLLHAPKFPAEFYNVSGNGQRKLGKPFSYMPGLRAEANFINSGRHLPATGYNGLGISVFLPGKDSMVFDAKLKSGQMVNNILSTRKVSCIAIGYRFGYEIPQLFNEFLMIHIGMGMGYARYTYKNVIPEKTAAFNYEQSDFSESTFRTYSNGGVFFEPIAGILYEFEHYSLIAQYSMIYPFTIRTEATIRFSYGANVGLYIPIKTL